MLKNHLIIAFRNLVRDKFYSFLNIAGLSVGVAASLLIILYITDELSYDRFLKDRDRVYRVVTSGKFGEQATMNVAVTSAPLAEGFRNNIPDIESAARIAPTQLIINHQGEVIKEEKVLYADSTFFNIFSFTLLEGDRNKVLKDPNSLVMTREAAIKYFGKDSVSSGKVVGQLIKSGQNTYKVTGIMQDVPENSHLEFTMLISMSSFPDAQQMFWLSMNFYTYLKFKPHTEMSALPDKFRNLVIKYVWPQVVEYLHYPESRFSRETMDDEFRYAIQPVTSIHLHSNLYAEMHPNGNIQYIYIFGVIAVFLILIACINFMNLATAQSAHRAREVGIRKSLGSSSGRLASQFMTESLVFIIIAIILSLGLAEAFRIPFNTLAEKNLSFNIFLHPWLLALIAAITLVLGLLAGAYPAFYLTRYNAVEVLKGSVTGGRSRSLLRNILVISQFVISIGMIVCTIVVFKQMNFVRTKNLGFEKENVVVLYNGWDMGGSGIPFKQELVRRSDVVSASFSTHVPSQIFWSSTFKAEGENGSDHIVYYCFADYDYLETLELKMLQGRYYSKDYPSDSAGIVINEAAAWLFGWQGNRCADAIGKNLKTLVEGGKRQKLQVIGVVRDYNFESLYNAIRPMAIRLMPTGPDLVVRLKPGNPMTTLKEVKEMWKAKVPWVPFEYSFLNEDYNKLFEKESTMGTIFIIFAGLSIFIACLGLFGLAAYTSQQRTKEIGIRKVMGATSIDMVSMLTRDFTKLVVLSFVLAIPGAWYFLTGWLKTFAFKTSIGIWPFAVAGIIALGIAWLTVSYQSIHAARTNPVDSLRNE